MPKEEMTQTPERYYQCPVCWKTFTKPHTVKIHMRVHTGERPYQCSYCPKSFTTSGNLGDHLRVHSPARMFKCKLCGAKFKRKATLKRHHEMHAKYKREKKLKGGSDVLQSENGEELLQNEIIYQPLYFTNCEPNQRVESNTGIIVTEQSEEILQTEIVNYPTHNLDEFHENRTTTSIEHLLQPEDSRENQENIVVIPPIVKEEKIDDFYDATILELSEEAEDIDGMQVKVHNSMSGLSSVSCKPSIHLVVDGNEEKNNSLPYKVFISKSKSDGSFHHSSVFKKPLEVDPPSSDLSKRYGGYITKMIKLIQTKEEQTNLIKELNQTIHEFIIENR